MTDEQLNIILALAGVTYFPGSWDKRFSRTLYAKVKNREPLTEKQAEWIYRLLYKYRRQIPNTYSRYSNHPHCGPKK